jgi:serine-type D-Ala-D-Ala endopeptidase (penicillin-binding protein 7)
MRSYGMHALRRLVLAVGLAVGLSSMVSPDAEAATGKARKEVVAKKSAHKVARSSKAVHVARKGAATKGSRVSHAAASADKPSSNARSRVLAARAAAPVPLGDRAAARHGDEPLSLSSSAALVVDQNTREVLLSKNDKVAMPIASITKLMTGLLVAEANLPLDEEITITQDDVDTYKGTGSRLAVGTRLTRGELMHLALMSSENRAAHALGRTYPGGLEHFVRLMNHKASELGMKDTRYVEPTGLSSDNRSSAQDLARLVTVAYERPILRELSTSSGYSVEAGHRTLQFRNSNRLTDSPEWNIGLQKTGYIAEAGRCLVMSVNMAGRQLIMVFLDAADKAARIGDAQRVRRWVESVVQSEQRTHELGHASHKG